MSSPQQFVLPDLFKMCPWSISMNPHYKTAGAEAAAWIDSFGFFRGRKRTEFRSAAAELCTARTYPYAGYDEYRTACDFVNLLFVVDETCDDLEGPEAAKVCDVFRRAMRGEVREDSAAVRMTRVWKERLDRKHLPNSQRRFLKHFNDYLAGILRETELRDESRIVDIDQCVLLRREFSGTQTTFALFEYAHGFDLPDAVFDNKNFMAMYWAAVDMVNFANDLYSYKMEAERGIDGSNLLTVLMHTKGLQLQEAVNQTGEHFRGLVNTFVQNKEQLPSFSTVTGGYPGIDEDVSKYVYSMEQWVIGSLSWSFESPRYFGTDRANVARTLIVSMKKLEYDDGL